MSRLGRRQVDVLRAAAAGTSYTHHSGQGRFSISGVDDVYGDDVLDRLHDLGLIVTVDDGKTIAGFKVELTDAGREALAGVGS